MTIPTHDSARSDDKSKDHGLGSGYFSYEGLNRVLHEKARLGILTALRTRTEGLVFTELKELCSLTDGNLCRHLQVLQEAGLVQLHKSPQGRDRSRPQTTVRLSREGIKQFDDYLEELQRVIQDASIRLERSPEKKRKRGRPGLSEGWVVA